ncbi:MAG: hypothetical protein LBV29_02990 [Azoarcus sp.]|jgi:hypothetical protein|nr:hypothetical protein [Azoarcus sp.]
MVVIESTNAATGEVNIAIFNCAEGVRLYAQMQKLCDPRVTLTLTYI